MPGLTSHEDRPDYLRTGVRRGRWTSAACVYWSAQQSKQRDWQQVTEHLRDQPDSVAATSVTYDYTDERLTGVTDMENPNSRPDEVKRQAAMSP